MASEQEKRLRRHSKVVLSRCSKLLEELLDKTPSIERLQLAIEEFEVKLTNYDKNQSVIELSMISEEEIEKEVEDGSKYREEKIDVLCKAKKLFEELNCASEKKKAEKTESVVKSEAAGTSCVRAFLCTTASHDPEPKFQDDKPAEARTYYSSDCNGQTATLMQGGKTPVPFKQMETTLIEVDACVNSRPLLQTSDSDTYLTPSHFLVGRGCPLNPPELAKLGLLSEVPHYPDYEKILVGFWEFWQRDYLRSLPPLSNRKQISNLKVGSLVLIHEEHKKRLQWNLGLVENVYIGVDGKVRAARVKSKSSHLVRPVQRLLWLELDPGLSENMVYLDACSSNQENVTLDTVLPDIEKDSCNESLSQADDHPIKENGANFRVSRFGRKIKDKVKPSV